MKKDSAYSEVIVQAKVIYFTINCFPDGKIFYLVPIRYILSMIIRYAVFIFGAVFYSFAISTLFPQIRIPLSLTQARRTLPGPSLGLWMPILMELSPRKKSLPSPLALNIMARKSRRPLPNMGEELISINSPSTSTPRQVFFNLCSYFGP